MEAFREALAFLRCSGTSGLFSREKKSETKAELKSLLELLLRFRLKLELEPVWPPKGPLPLLEKTPVGRLSFPEPALLVGLTFSSAHKEERVFFSPSVSSPHSASVSSSLKRSTKTWLDRKLELKLSLLLKLKLVFELEGLLERYSG